jgi:hypothetical protein
MIQSDKARVLTAFLSTLPEEVAVRLAKAVEFDRLAEGKVLPHDLILAALRPVLRRAEKADRTPTPLRLFCQPFQDLLVSEPRAAKAAGRIAHASINPVWKWLAHTVLPEETLKFFNDVKSDVLGYRVDNANLRAQEFWPIASAGILKALASSAGTKAARAALGGEAGVADAREMAQLLSVGGEIAELQKKVPRSTASLGDEVLRALREIYEAVVQKSPDAAPYVAVVAMNRLARPWEALRLPLAVSRQTHDTLISATDMGLVGEILFADIEEHAVAVRAAHPLQFDPGSLVTHIAAFATLSGGMVKEVEMRRAGKWGQRLLKDRAAVAEVMDDYMKRAPREILGALPTLRTGVFSGGPRVPDIRHAPDPHKSERAVRFAKLIAGCRSFAAAGSFGASLADAQDELTAALHSYSEGMLRELKAAEGERRNHAQQYFALATELTGLLASAEEGEFLRRRGRAALSQAAA